MALYDTIGHGYRDLRRPDPRIAARILGALGDATSVVNVGAGAGSYEPVDRKLIAVEPSGVMVRQRPADAAPVVRASACDLPFRDDAVDAALAILTLHHWPDLERGLSELRRVARRRVVVLTFDPSFEGFWLTDYLPEILEIDRRSLPPLSFLAEQLGGARIFDVPIPEDCTDGFLAAYWKRPEAYLRPEVRAAISVLTRLADPAPGLAALRRDLDSGDWARRYGRQLGATERDLGYRLLVGDLEASRGVA